MTTPAPLPQDEAARLAALRAYNVLASPPEAQLELRALAAKLRESEARNHESEARAQSIIDHMLSGLLTVDEDHLIESVNPAAAAIFGYDGEELVGSPLSMILPELGASYVEQTAAPGSERKGRRKNGEIFRLELSLCHFQYRGRQLLAGIVRDLSELDEVDRLKRELVSTVNHELRTPLTSIRGSLTLIASGVLGEISAEAGEVIALAERNCLRLIALTNDILDLERLDVGNLEMKSEPVPVARLLERSCEVVLGMAADQGIGIETLPTPLVALGDDDRLYQVMVNLLSNAIKFSPRGSLVTLSAVERQGQAEIRVQDRGRGISPAFHAAIFERFQQVETSDAREKGGTGLGLAICKSIVANHGGTIGVESSEGLGSTFWFRIPLAADGERAAPANANPGPLAQPSRFGRRTAVEAR